MASYSGGSSNKVANVTPPLKGSFPLDYKKKCHMEMLEYSICLREKDFRNDDCRERAKTYFRCRMTNGLMDKDEWPKLGFKSNLEEETSDDVQPSKQAYQSSNGNDK